MNLYLNLNITLKWQTFGTHYLCDPSFVPDIMESDKNREKPMFIILKMLSIIKPELSGYQSLPFMCLV